MYIDTEANRVNVAGYTALHRAASWGHTDCLRVLVANGADLHIQNAHGERAREAAARYQKDTCVDYLDRAGIKHNYNIFHNYFLIVWSAYIMFFFCLNCSSNSIYLY